MKEEEIDQFINSLNKDEKPSVSDNEETAELQAIARKVRGLRPIADPSEGFTTNLREKLLKQTSPDQTDPAQRYSLQLNSSKKSPVKRGNMKHLPWMGLVASILAIVILISPWTHSRQNIVSAMEQTVKQLENYHGNLEKRSTNAGGETQVYQQTEIWVDGNKYATRNKDGVVTVNNSDTRWLTNPTKKEIHLLPLYLDSRDFDLKKEASKALEYPHQIVGEDSIAGRNATRIEVTPPGGLPYFLWIDQESNLPIQLQTAMQKSIQTTYTYVALETNTDIPSGTFTYHPPKDYQVIDENPDKLINNLENAKVISGLEPINPPEKPQRIFASLNRIVFDYGDTVIIETKATLPLNPSPQAILGRAGDGQLEILPDSLRWQQRGLEIKVQGKRAEEFTKKIATNIVIPEKDQLLTPGPSVKVEIDMEVLKNSQQQVDAGSSPWQVDPIQVAFTFANLQVSPEGITGEPPIDYESLVLTTNTGTDAVVEISEGPIKKVYLKRLIRQDESGIWAVIGYDPVR